MWFDVHPADIGYTQRSPFQFRNETVLDVPPDRAFEIVGNDEGASVWFKDFVACRWTSAAPHGVGSTREIELKILTVKERFLVWEPGKRATFCIYATTLPIVTQMVEDMSFEPADNGGTRFIWNVHYTPSMLMRPVHGIARKLFGGMFETSIEGLRRYTARR
jgi:hypothetical protein